MPERPPPTTNTQDALPPRAHFCQGGVRGGAANIGAGFTAAIIPTAILGGIGLSIAGFFALARYPWLPLAARATVMTIIFLLAMIALFRTAARGYTRVMSAIKLPMEMDPRARVNVICWPDQKDRLEPLIPPPDDPGYFEPEAVRVWVARRGNHAARMLDPKAARRFIIMVSLLPVTLNFLFQGVVHNLVAREALFVLCTLLGIALVGLILLGFLFPRFLRIAPGRVDIVRFGFLGRAPTIETISLRDRPVRLDLRRRELLIGGWHDSHPQPEPEAEPKDEPEPAPEPKADRKPPRSRTRATAEEDERTKKARSAMLEQFMKSQKSMSSQYTLGTPEQIKAVTIVPLWATFDARTIQEAIFRAAVSTAEPGPLPTDRLIG